MAVSTASSANPPARRSLFGSAIRERALFLLLVAPNLFFITAFTFWPLAQNAWLSLHEWDMIAPIQVYVGLDNYIDAARDPLFREVLGHTFVLMGGAVAATLALGLVLALLMNQKLRFRDGARAIVFSPTMLSGAAIAVVWVYVFDPNYGLIRALTAPLGVNSPNWLRDPAWALLAVIIVYVWKNVGYAMVIFLAGLQSIPKVLYEAALVDGAGPWTRFTAVTVPGLSPISFFLLVTSILASFQTFDIIQVLTQGGPVNATNTLIYHLYEEGFVGFHAGRAGVVAVVLFVLMLTVTALQMRYVERRVHYS